MPISLFIDLWECDFQKITVEILTQMFIAEISTQIIKSIFKILVKCKFIIRALVFCRK